MLCKTRDKLLNNKNFTLGRGELPTTITITHTALPTRDTYTPLKCLCPTREIIIAIRSVNQETVCFLSAVKKVVFEFFPLQKRFQVRYLRIMGVVGAGRFRDRNCTLVQSMRAIASNVRAA